MSRNCPVCNSSSNEASLFLPLNIDGEKITTLSYASRKNPEYMNYKLLCCHRCDLVFASDPPLEADLEEAYHNADYDSKDEAKDAAISYIKAISSVLNRLKNKSAVLEIGAGTGIFLEYLAKYSFTTLIGVEPSVAAINAAENTNVKIHRGFFNEQDFPAESFDLICCFMTMEHVKDPLELAKSAYKLLRPGGAFVVVTHNYRGVINKVLGKKSPIIDIEHLQLFSPDSLSYMFNEVGFEDVIIRAFRNTYSLGYWIKISPLPYKLKQSLINILDKMKWINVRVALPAGNLMTAGYKV